MIFENAETELNPDIEINPDTEAAIFKSHLKTAKRRLYSTRWLRRLMYIPAGLVFVRMLLPLSPERATEWTTYLAPGLVALLIIFVPVAALTQYMVNLMDAKLTAHIEEALPELSLAESQEVKHHIENLVELEIAGKTSVEEELFSFFYMAS